METLLSPENSNRRRKENILWAVLWAIFFGYATLHFIYIVKMAVDIPYWDEWDLFFQNNSFMGWNPHFLFGFMNEHRSLASKLLLLINYQFFGLNFRYQIIFNFFLFLGLIYILWKIVGEKIQDGRSPAVWVAFFVFLSPILYEVHSMGFLGGKHLYLATFILGFYFLFFKESWVFFGLGVCFLIFSIFSFAACFAGVFSGMLIYWIWNFTQKPNRYILKSLLTFFFIGSALFAWIWKMPQLSSPSSHHSFWRVENVYFFFELISSGFGFTKLGVVPATLCPLILLFAFLLSFGQSLRKRKNDPQLGFILALTFGVLGMLGLIAVGRSDLPVWQAKSSRYAAISIFLPLLSLGLFYLNGPWWWRRGSLMIVALLVWGFCDKFNPTLYDLIYSRHWEGKQCVEAYLRHPEGKSGLYCPAIYPGEMSRQLAHAKELGIHFTLFNRSVKTLSD